MKILFNRYVLIIFGIILLAVIIYNIFWFILLKGIPTDVKPSVKNVLAAYYKSRVTGDYWENELEVQAKQISSLPQSDRVIFFRNVLVKTCDLDTSRSIVFIKCLGDDAEALLNDLKKFNKDEGFHELSTKQKDEVEKWIEELQIITNIKKEETSN